MNQTIIFDPLPYVLDSGQLLRQLHVKPASSTEAEVTRLLEEAAAVARPRAICRMSFIEAKGPNYVILDGVTFTSRVLRVNLDRLQRAFVYVCTVGRELADWAQRQQDPLARFWADSINQAVLGAAMAALERRLRHLYGLQQTARMNPGSLRDWPLSEQRPLFQLLGDVNAAIGVTLTDSLLMMPTKSVSGILFPTEETFASCQLCPREACPNRRMPYEPELFERKYKIEG